MAVAPTSRLGRLPAGARFGAGGTFSRRRTQPAGEPPEPDDETAGSWPTWAILVLIALVGAGVTVGGVGFVLLGSDRQPVAPTPAAAQPIPVPSVAPEPALPEEDFEAPATTGTPRPTSTGRSARPTATTQIVVIGQRCPRAGERARAITGERVRCERARDRRLRWQVD